jgi:NAD(P)-dependent dehydrogenase (short-subunit alcohol dehydrogenase family)
MSIAGKKVVITGGSSGIGLVTAQAVVAQEAHVIIVGRSPEKLRVARQQIGKNVETTELDVTKEADVQSFFEAVGPFDHLITAAGPEAGDQPLLQLETGAARAMFESKFWGQYYAVKYAAPSLRSGGTITLFSGWISRKPMAGLSTFAAIDGAIESLARVLALELAPIRVNVVTPGVIQTPLWNPLPEEARRATLSSFASALPVQRVGQSEDVSKAILYLIDNGFSTGAVVDIDGGQK